MTHRFVLLCIYVLCTLWCTAQDASTLQRADSLDKAAAACSEESRHEEAVRLSRESIALLSESGGTRTDRYAHTANRLSKYLSYTGRLTEAIQWGKTALAITEKTQGKESAVYAQMLSDQAGYYSRSGDYHEALRLGTEALQIRERVVGKDHIDYAHSLNNLARYHSYLGNHIESIRLGRKAVELKSKLTGTQNADYAQSLSNLAGYYSRMGNYAHAIEIGEAALHIREQVLGKQHPDYAQSLNNLAKYHYFQNEFGEAIQLGTEALQLREKIYGRHHSEYATALSNLADYYLHTGDLQKALSLGKEALEIRQRVFGDKHPDCAESLANLAGYYYAQGDYSKAVETGRNALALQYQILGDEHPAYAQSLCKQAVYFSADEQADSAAYYASKATRKYTDVILTTFADLTSNERDLYWKKVKPWFTNTLLQLAGKTPTPGMLSSAYNSVLLAKGLLLNSELEMTNLLMESGDTAAVEAYRALQENRSLLIRQYECAKSDRSMNTDSLERIITKQERHLVRRSKTYGNYTKQLRIEWPQIQRELRPDELAIEFIYYPSRQGRGQYGALLLSTQQKSPLFIPLMDDEELNEIPKKELYTTTRLSEIVWKPLKDYLNKAKRVYFAPVGELYNLGIENLPHWKDKGRYMADTWQLYRLSSTREIVLSKEKKRPRQYTAAIFGGMTYDSHPEVTADDDETEQWDSSYEHAAKYLPGTKTEAEEIYATLLGHQIPCEIYLGAEATEKTLKSLSGHVPTDMHIATHGFYWTDKEVNAHDMQGRLQFLSMYNNLDDADKALTRSGLLFSGANQALTGHKMSYRNDDGVLTAKEISLLDLRGLDLLVLSACQTGLGKVTGDGVFGLQRGFKKAGATTMLMSLWKVDDKATRLLMTYFYSNLMSGMSKHASLIKAQEQLRQTEMESVSRNRRGVGARAKRAKKNQQKKTYSDPYYWAAFILLDSM